MCFHLICSPKQNGLLLSVLNVIVNVLLMGLGLLTVFLDTACFEGQIVGREFLCFMHAVQMSKSGSFALPIFD